ncbi:MAG: hypothetical protein JNK05_23920 [Myxococcales bacterium]|nr:hypothetical protein [Myxococcales bacterium]
MRWFALLGSLVTVACASPSPTTLCPERYSEASEIVRDEALSEADVVFALDSSTHTREHFARLVEALDVLVAPRCISRTAPGGGPPVECDPNNPDHVRQYRPIPSLRIGFVSADLGASGSADPACDSRAGADGRLARAPEAPTRWEEQPAPRTVPVGEGWYYDRTRTVWNPTCDRAISFTRRVGSTVGFILRTSCMFDHGADPTCRRSEP